MVSVSVEKILSENTVGGKKKIEKAKGMRDINVYIRSLDGTLAQQLDPDVTSPGMDAELY